MREIFDSKRLKSAAQTLFTFNLTFVFELFELSGVTAEG